MSSSGPTVALHFRTWEGPGDTPLVILHGLLGSSRNWLSVAPALSSAAPVVALDLRNHGESPHAPVHDYTSMVADIEALRIARGWESMHLIGHSMGGKTAMRLACDFPHRVRSLTVVDIAAADHQPYHAREVEALCGLRLDDLVDRRDAEEKIAVTVSDWAMRQFLLTNLRRSPAGWRWSINLPVIRDALPSLARNSLRETDRFAGPMLLLKGEESHFLTSSDALAMKRYFPHLEFTVIPRAGHNIHFEQKDLFVERVLAFIHRAP